jgi:hypothetical protein
VSTKEHLLVAGSPFHSRPAMEQRGTGFLQKTHPETPQEKYYDSGAKYRVLCGPGMWQIGEIWPKEEKKSRECANL